jgi:hypothetical protein
MVEPQQVGHDAEVLRRVADRLQPNRAPLTDGHDDRLVRFVDRQRCRCVRRQPGGQDFANDPAKLHDHRLARRMVAQPVRENHGLPFIHRAT